MRRTATTSTLALAFTFALAIAPAAAGADPGGGAHGGQSARHDDPSASVTEDTDTNDGGTPNNVADSGDNQHPSGKDRSVEHGGSGNQGNTSADPDDDGHGPDRSNGGPDVPGGSGGVDKADQDRNNGCGNDDDFEDDNEGWCGRHPRPEHGVEHQHREQGETPEAAATSGAVLSDVAARAVRLDSAV